MSRWFKHDIVCDLCGQHVDEWFPYQGDDGELYHRECYSNLHKFIKYNQKADVLYKKILEKMGNKCVSSTCVWKPKVECDECNGDSTEERIKDVTEYEEDEGWLTTTKSTDKKDG